MTTNKPEVFYATNLYSSAPVACLMRRTGEKAEPVIRLSDYEALQAECEKLRTILSETAAAVGAHADPACSLEFMADIPKEVESVVGRLRKDAKRYVPLNEAVQRAAAELPEGWEIHLCAMRDSGWVDLIGPDGTEDFDTDNERLDYTVIDALEFAITAAIQEDNP